MAMETKPSDGSTIKEPQPLPNSSRFHFIPYRATDVKAKEMPKPQKGFMVPQVATANDGATKTVQNAQTTTVTLYRQIDLIHYIQDPYLETEKQTMEGAVRRNFAVRTSMWIREMCAYKKSKLVVELSDHTKMNLKDSEIKAKVDALMKNPKVVEILKKFDTRDNNLQLPQLHVKKLAWQLWTFGRGCTIIFYKDNSYKEISGLDTINSRRLFEPVLDEKNNLSFEGIIVDGQGLDKNSCIYATYQERDITPHTEGYGYSPTEPIMYVAQAHNVILEEDFNEIAKSGWLPSIGLKINTTNLTTGNKQTQISNIINAINPGKITGISADDVEGDPIMLDMKPDFTGLVALADSLEEKIYNNYHIPLFYVKSDKISNVATAKKSLQAFKDSTVADDQELMENILASQWYDPLLREELKEAGALQDTANNQAQTNALQDTSAPTDAQMPLEWVIRRRFEPPTIDDLLDLASVCQILLNNRQIDLQKANEIMGFPEELTARVEKENEEKQEEFEEKQKENPNQPPNKNTNQDETE